MATEPADVKRVLAKRLREIERQLIALKAEKKGITTALEGYTQGSNGAVKREKGAVGNAVRKALEEIGKPAKPVKITESAKQYLPTITRSEVRNALVYGKKKRRFRHTSRGWSIRESPEPA